MVTEFEKQRKHMLRAIIIIWLLGAIGAAVGAFDAGAQVDPTPECTPQPDGQPLCTSSVHLTVTPTMTPVVRPTVEATKVVWFPIGRK